MSILRRFKAIMEANFNTVLDNMEHPEKMIDYYLEGLEKDLGEVKHQTAQVMVAYEKAARERKRCQDEVVELTTLSQKAQGNEADLQVISSELAFAQSELDTLIQAEEIARENRQKMLQMHDKLNRDIQILRQKRSLLKAKLAVVNTNNMVSRYTIGSTSAADNLKQFHRIEERVDDMLAVSNAMAELEDKSYNTPILALKEKYRNVPVPAIEDKQDKQEETAATA